MSDLKTLFHSPLADQMIEFVEMKRGCGYKYEVNVKSLRRLDRYLVENGLSRKCLPQKLMEPWLNRRSYENLRNQSARVSIVRQFAQYLLAVGVPAYYPSKYSIPKRKMSYVPYVFSTEQIHHLFKTADALPFQRKKYPYMKAFPVLLRLLYSTGLRVGEASNLQWRDFDVSLGVLRIREGKMGKDRLIAMSSQMTNLLKKHAKRQKQTLPDTPIFPGYCGKRWSNNSIYTRFRKVLFRAGISHGGKGKGPRLHDLRHTFAVHNLEKWLKTKKNLDVHLSILADYLGHVSLEETQHYLRLMPSIYPEIVSRMEKSVGKKIRRWKDETS